MSIHSVECNVGTNPITIETGKMARLADGAVVVRSGDTVVLVTVVSATKVKEGQTFFPLSVEYKEKAAAAGMFPGGKNIKAIQAESGADINIEEDGTVHIYASKQEGLDRALELVTRMFKTIEIGELYTGKIVSTTTFGAFMEVLPGKDGLIHISELAEGRTAKTEDVVSVGDVVTAKCIGIDDKGRVKMSVRAALRDAKAAEAEAAGITE